MEPEVKIIGRYRWWPVVDSLPAGWLLDELNASPFYGHRFAHLQGRSVLTDQRRLLVAVVPQERLAAASSYRAWLAGSANGERTDDAAA